LGWKDASAMVPTLPATAPSFRDTPVTSKAGAARPAALPARSTFGPASSMSISPALVWPGRVGWPGGAVVNPFFK
jgi:hypothetical protein